MLRSMRFWACPGEGCISLRGMRFWACPERDESRFGVCISGRARRGKCISLRGMVFRACPPGGAFRFEACISGRARREMHHASGHAFLGVPGVRCNTLRGMFFRARLAWDAFQGVPRSEMHHASGDVFQGVPGVRGITLRGMHFRACPAGGCITLRGMRFRACPPWDSSRFGVCVSGRARREMRLASRHAFLGVPGVRGLSLRGMRFWARLA